MFEEFPKCFAFQSLVWPRRRIDFVQEGPETVDIHQRVLGWDFLHGGVAIKVAEYLRTEVDRQLMIFQIGEPEGMTPFRQAEVRYFHSIRAIYLICKIKINRGNVSEHVSESERERERKES